MYTIHLAKDAYKFSCAHFTLFSATQAERLHGHNYQVRVSIGVEKLDTQLGLAFNFNSVKPMIRALCDHLDERILISTQSPFLQIRTSDEQTEIVFASKRYSFPTEDVCHLPLVNITCEELARHFCGQLRESMLTLSYWSELEVEIEETRGQSVSFKQKR